MLRRLVAAGAARKGWWRRLSTTNSSISSVSKAQNISSAVDSMILRSLRDHYVEVSKWNPPRKENPPSDFAVIKGALDGDGPVLSRTFGNEEIRISVMRLANILAGAGEDDESSDINQLFLHVEVSKPEQEKSLHFLCGLYPDAVGIHGITMRPKLDQSGFLDISSEYCGPFFGDLDEGMRDGLHSYIEERGVNQSLFPFLQAWLYVKEHRTVLRWFETLRTFVSESKSAKDD